MIICSKCTFEVSYKMRHAISVNACPSCGSVLLNNIEVKKISTIVSKLKKEDFSKTLEEELVTDISFFIYFHIVKAITLNSGNQNSTVEDSEGGDSLSTESDAELDKISAADKLKSVDIASLRKEVEGEVLLEYDESLLDEEENDASRVSRLKDMAKRQKLASKTPLKVKRVAT